MAQCAQFMGCVQRANDFFMTQMNRMPMRCRSGRGEGGLRYVTPCGLPLPGYRDMTPGSGRSAVLPYQVIAVRPAGDAWPNCGVPRTEGGAAP
jgi:hypothetical protein